MPRLFVVQYGRLKYPSNVRPRFVEIPGHFDVRRLAEHQLPYSLHTEYSYGSRRFDNPIVSQFPELVQRQTNGVPRLWASGSWAVQFAHYVLQLASGDWPPDIVEVHPPYVSDCSSVDEFLDRYSLFEEEIRAVWPSTCIVLENRSGTPLRRERFLVSMTHDITTLCERVQSRRHTLRMVLDVPQLMSAHRINAQSTPKATADLMSSVKPHADLILGIHLWGKIGRAAHHGDLRSLCHNRADVKEALLGGLADLLDDGIDRYLVPEVNDRDPSVVLSVLQDLESAGFELV